MGTRLRDTQDLVKETVLQVVRKLDTFDVRGEGALRAYQRQAVLNRIREELRRANRRPSRSELDSQAPDDVRSPLDEAIGQEAVERYERALATLRTEDREAVVTRIELGCTNREIAELLGKPSANAARMAVERAIVRLARAMGNARA